MKKLDLMILTIVCSFMLSGIVWADRFITEFESNDGTIVGQGPVTAGTNTAYVDTTYGYSPSHALRWTYNFLPSGPGGDYPGWQINFPQLQDWSGATSLGAWIYLDMSTTDPGGGPVKTAWTIQFWARDTVARHDLGNWNEGTTGAPIGQWYFRTWPTSGTLEGSGVLLSEMTGVGCYFHAGDGWSAWTTSDGAINIYIDDIQIFGSTTVVPPQISPGFASLKPGASQMFTVSGTPGPYTWSLSTTSLGTLDVSTGEMVTFTSSSVVGTLTLSVTDANLVVNTATITISPTSAPLVKDPERVIFNRKKFSDKDYDLFE